MGRRKGSKKAETQEQKEARLLGDEFLNKLNSSNEKELREMSAEVSEDRVKLDRVKDSDMDLKAAKQAASTASEPYRTGFKRLDLKAKWITSRLESMGKDTGSGDFDTKDEENKTLSKEQIDELGGEKVLTPPPTASSPWDKRD